MNRVVCTLLSLLCLGHAQAQVAQWLIPPEYDKIEMPANSNVLLSHKDNACYLWDTDGKQLEQLTNQLHPYCDGYAVATDPKTGIAKAFYDTDGKKTSINKYNVKPAWDHAMFHDSFMLVSDGTLFYYLNDKGVLSNTPYHLAYPFCSGYAMCINYAKPQKMKDPMYLLLDTNLKPVPLWWEDKRLDTDDIEFISSVNAAGVGIVEAKGKLFFFSATNGGLKPIMSTPNDINPKNHARLDGSLEESFTFVGDTIQQLTAKSGKRGIVTITFDRMLRPTAIDYSGESYTFEKKDAPQSHQPSLLSIKTDSRGQKGINWDGEEMLPPQFDDIPLCFADKAVVAIDGKQGLLQIHRNDKFRMRLNKGEPIGFRHHRFDTDIRLDLPPYITPAATTIEMGAETGCRVDNIPYETKEASLGNYAYYRCELFMPDSLTDEAVDITYPAHVIYGQLRSPVIVMKSTTWHMKYFNVDINDDDYSINDGMLSFSFNVIADRQPGESIYPHEAQIFADSLQAEITDRISETRYKGKVSGLHEGMNTFVIRIVEKGCPPSDFTFEVNYISRPTRGEKKVTMKKKKKEVAMPRLRI